MDTMDERGLVRRDYSAARYSGASRPAPYERSGEAPARGPLREAPRSR